MFRKTAFASLIAFGAAAGAAQAANNGPQLVNRNGSQEVVYDAGARDNVVGGGDNTVYNAAPGARTEEPALVGRLSGGGDDEAITYITPARLGGRG